MKIIFLSLLLFITTNAQNLILFGDDVVIDPNVLTDGSFTTACGVFWSCASGWNLTGGDAVATATTGNLQQLSVLTVGVTYTVSFEITNYSSGSVRAVCGGTAGTIRSANGIYTQSITCTSTGTFGLDGVTAFTGRIAWVKVIPE